MSAKTHIFTKGGWMHRATYSEICELILNSWDKIPNDIMKKAFQKSEIIDVEQNIGDDGVSSSSNVVYDDSHSDDELDLSTNSDTEKPFVT